MTPGEAGDPLACVRVGGAQEKVAPTRRFPMSPLFVLLFAVSVIAAPVPKELKKAKPSVNGQ